MLLMTMFGMSAVRNVLIEAFEEKIVPPVNQNIQYMRDSQTT